MDDLDFVVETHYDYAIIIHVYCGSSLKQDGHDLTHLLRALVIKARFDFAFFFSYLCQLACGNLL